MHNRVRRLAAPTSVPQCVPRSSPQHHTRDHRNEQPRESPCAHAELRQEGRRARDVDEEGGEVQRRDRGEQQEIQPQQHRAVVVPQHARVQRLALRARERLGKARCPPGADADRERQHHPEDRAPARNVQQRTADDRRQRGSDTEHERRLRHQPLRFGPLEAIANHRTSDDQPGAGGKSLERAEEPQRFDVARDRAAQRGEAVDREPAQDDGPAAEGIRQRAVPQHHECIREQIRRQRLLHGDRRRVEFGCNGRECRQVHVDRKGSEHRQRREERRKGPRTLVRKRYRTAMADEGGPTPHRMSTGAVPANAASTALRVYCGANSAMNS